MRLNILFVVLLAVVVILMISDRPGSQVRDHRNEEWVVNVGTSTAVMVGGYQPWRRYYYVENWSASYYVYHATWQITQAQIQSATSGISKGKVLTPYYDNWEDKYNIWQSSWYVLLSSAGAPAGSTALSAPVYWYERY